MTKKRILGLTNILVILAMMFGGLVEGFSLVYAQTGSIISGMILSDEDLAVGETLTVDVYIDVSGSDSLLGAYTGSLNWDPLVLEYQSYSGAPPAGTSGGIVNDTNVTTGEIIFNSTFVSGASGSTTAITIDFLTVGAGSGNLDLEFSSMSTPSPFNDLLPILTVEDETVLVSELIPGEVRLDESPVYEVMETGNSIDVDITVGDGDDRLILVGVSYNFSGESTIPTIGSVIFTPTNPSGDPIALDLVVDQFSPSGSGDTGRKAAIYVLDPLDNPSVETEGKVTVAFAGGDGDYTTGAVVGVAQFEGVDQADPLGDSSGAAISNDDDSVTLSVSTTGSELVFDTVWTGGSGTWTMNAGTDVSDTSQTELWSDGFTNTMGGASIKPASETSTSMSWWRSNNGYMALVAVVINPAMVEPPTCYPLTLSSGENGDDPTADPANSDYCAAGEYVEGEVIDLTAHPMSGYQVSLWSGTDDDGSVELTNQLTMPTSSAAVSVYYEIEPIIPEVVQEGIVSYTSDDDVATISFAHTTGSGVNRLLLVGISWNCGSTDRTITSVVFNDGTAHPFTEVFTQLGYNSSNPRYSAIYSLLNPPSGQAGTVTVNFSGSVSNGIMAGAANFAGVDQTTPLGTPDGAADNSTTASVELTGLNGDELIFDNVFRGASSTSHTLTVGDDQTELWNPDYIANLRESASIEQATSSSVVMSWTLATGNYWAIAAVPINPAPAPSSYNLTVAASPSSGGTTTPSAGIHSYIEDTPVDVTATPAAGYEFTGWTGACTGTDPCQITMDADKSVTANFALIEYTLDITIVGSGSVNKNPDQVTYHYGDSVELTAVPATDWVFDSWSVDLTGSDNPDTILIDGNKNVTATFVEAPEGNIELDGSVSSTTADGVSVVSFAHTTGTGVGRLLMVGVSANSYNGEQTISSVTFTPDGDSVIPLTEVGSIENEAGRLSAIYGLVNPPSGESGIITITFSGSVSYGIIAGAVNFSGVDQGDPFDDFESAVGTESVAISLDVDTDPADVVFSNVFIGSATIPTITVGAGQTELWNDSVDRAGGVADFEEALSSTTTVSWTASGTTDAYYWAIGAVPINPMAIGDIYDLTIAVSPTGGGTTDPVVGTHSYLADAIANISASANSGYEFDHWDGDVADPNSASTTVTMDATKSVTAYFTTVTIPITFTGEELLGRPTDDSISIKVVPDEAILLHYDYGTSSGDYTGQTTNQSATAGDPVTTVIDGLAADMEYFYRMQYSTDAGNTWVARDELSFNTQRAEGSEFTFDITTDNHVNILLGNASTWTQTLNDVADDDPDFLIDLGDTFDMRSLSEGDVSGAENSYMYQYQFFNIVSGSTPIFLVPGNHEQQEAWHLDGTANSLAVIGVNAQKKFYLNPVPDGSFYTGDESTYEFISGDQLKQDYYAFEWGDALFVTISPYWYTTTKPYVSDLGGGEDDWTGSGDAWDWSLGQEQFDWLKATLEGSDAKYKFVFSHQMTSDASLSGQEDYGHAGANHANLVEWGGYNEDGTTWGWDIERAGWGSETVHDLLVNYGVGAFFHGHDHQYAYESRDGVVYQAVPAAGFDGDGFDMYTTGDGYTIQAMDNPGHLRVTVNPEETCVEYIQTGTTSSAYTYCMEPAEERYDLTIAADPSDGGTIDPAVGTHSYTEDTVVPITATPAAGYEFDHWSGACTGDGACQVTMDDDKSVTAHFELVMHELTIDVEPALSGTTLPAIGTHVYEHGSVVDIIPTPASGYEFAYWSGDCDGTGACQVTIDDDMNVVAHFTQTAFNLTIIVDPAEGGTTVPSAGVHPYLEDSELAVVAQPAVGFEFDHWSGDCTGEGLCSIIMDSNKTVTAHFTAITFDLTVNVDPSGGGTTDPAAGVHNYAYGSIVPITATPATNYAFVEWTGDCTGTDPCEVEMLADMEVTAHFELVTHDLTIDVEPALSGTTLPAIGTHVYEHGSVVDIIPTPASGYEFAYWSGDCDGTGTCQVTVNDDMSVMAHFAQATYDLTILVDPVEGGTTNPGVGVHPYLEGSPVVVLADAAIGYVFDSWSGDCTGSGPCSLTMDSDKTITAHFLSESKACYVLTLGHTGDGSDPTPDIPNSAGCEAGTYEPGETINLSGVAPAGGWHIASWYGTEADSSTGDTNVVIMPEGDTEVGVDYKTYIFIPVFLGPNN